MAADKGKTSSDVVWTKEQMESLLHLYEQETDLCIISQRK
jgi:hypothetical protein